VIAGPRAEVERKGPAVMRRWLDTHRDQLLGHRAQKTVKRRDGPSAEAFLAWPAASQVQSDRHSRTGHDRHQPPRASLAVGLGAPPSSAKTIGSLFSSASNTLATSGDLIVPAFGKLRPKTQPCEVGGEQCFGAEQAWSADPPAADEDKCGQRTPMQRVPAPQKATAVEIARNRDALDERRGLRRPV